MNIFESEAHTLVVPMKGNGRNYLGRLFKRAHRKAFNIARSEQGNKKKGPIIVSSNGKRIVILFVKDLKKMKQDIAFISTKLNTDEQIAISMLENDFGVSYDKILPTFIRNFPSNELKLYPAYGEVRAA